MNLHELFRVLNEHFPTAFLPKSSKWWCGIYPGPVSALKPRILCTFSGRFFIYGMHCMTTLFSCSATNHPYNVISPTKEVQQEQQYISISAENHNVIIASLIVASKPWRMICLSAFSWSQVNARTFSRLDDEAFSVLTKPPPKTNSHPAGTFGNLHKIFWQKWCKIGLIFGEWNKLCPYLRQCYQAITVNWLLFT